MRVFLLGPPGVDADGGGDGLRPRERAVLAALAIRRGRAVSADQLDMSTQETLAALAADDRRRGTTTNPGRSERWAPLGGVLFAVAFAVGFLTARDTPAIDTSGQEVIAHYDDAGSILAGVVAAPIAGVGLLVFAGVLRNRMRTKGAEWLATVAFGGVAVYAAGLGLFATTQLALLDAADLGEPEVAQALNILDNDNFMPVVVGLAVTLLATGWHALTARSLPRWLGRITLALGVLAVAGPAGFIAFLLFPIWVLVTAVVLLRRHTGTLPPHRRRCRNEIAPVHHVAGHHHGRGPARSRLRRRR